MSWVVSILGPLFIFFVLANFVMAILASQYFELKLANADEPLASTQIVQLLRWYHQVTPNPHATPPATAPIPHARTHARTHKHTLLLRLFPRAPPTRPHLHPRAQRLLRGAPANKRIWLLIEDRALAKHAPRGTAAAISAWAGSMRASVALSFANAGHLRQRLAASFAAAARPEVAYR
jgi:hypothetical protein